MTNTYRYNHLVTLQPLDFFFFGGENTFGNGEGQNYYAKTRLLPQQTSVLGVLRFLGLKETPAPISIGESFDAEGASAPDYGYIHSLSPLFLHERPPAGVNDKANQPVRNLISAPWLASVAQQDPVRSPAGRVKQYSGNEWKSAYELPKFSAKYWPTAQLIGKKGSVPVDQVIQTSTRIGITKGKDGEERRDGFYKQEVGHLAPGWSFAVLADLDTQLAAKINSPVVIPFGAEKALCVVTITALEKKQTFEEYFPSELCSSIRSPNLRAAALMSDAMVDKKKLEALPFAIAGTVGFRNIRTPTKTTNFGLFRRGKHKGPTPDYMYQSEKYTLLRRGSVLFAESEKDLNDCLETNMEHWQIIGYNHYHIL